MNTDKYQKILETGMGALMSCVLNFSAMKMLGAPLSLFPVLTGWAGAFAVAAAINYLFPVMDWCEKITKGIPGKTAEYVIRVFLFAVMEIFLNSLWCLFYTGNIMKWPQLFFPLEAIGIPVIYIGLPAFSRIAAAFAGEPKS